MKTMTSKLHVGQKTIVMCMPVILIHVVISNETKTNHLSILIINFLAKSRCRKKFFLNSLHSLRYESNDSNSKIT